MGRMGTRFGYGESKGQMRRFVPLLVLALVLVACGGRSSAEHEGPSGTGVSQLEPTPEGNFVLYVSNQSFEIDPVDIRVTIDGKLAVDEDFEVEDQHNWVEYTFRLREGRHVLHAESRAGAAELTRSFELTRKTWAVLNYWYYPGERKRFSFDLSHQPVAFA